MGTRYWVHFCEQLIWYLLVFARIRFALCRLVPSRIFMACRSSPEICLNDGLVFFAGDVKDFIFSFSMSRRIFSFRRRRSSSFQSRFLRGRDGSAYESTRGKQQRRFEIGRYEFISYTPQRFIWWLRHWRKKKQKYCTHHRHADSHSNPMMNSVFRFSRHLTPIPFWFWWHLSVSQHLYVTAMFSPVASSCRPCNNCPMNCSIPNAMEMVLSMARPAIAMCLLPWALPHKWHRHAPNYTWTTHFRTKTRPG